MFCTQLVFLKFVKILNTGGFFFSRGLNKDAANKGNIPISHKFWTSAFATAFTSIHTQPLITINLRLNQHEEH